MALLSLSRSSPVERRLNLNGGGRFTISDPAFFCVGQTSKDSRLGATPKPAHNEARRIAANIAKLPELVRKP